MSTGFKVTQIGNYQVDLDDLLIRRQHIQSGLWVWGEITPSRRESSPVFNFVNDNVTWLDIAAGNSTRLAIDSNKNLWSWGQGIYGSLGDGTTINRYDIPQTVLGSGGNWNSCSCATTSVASIKTDGTLWVWGNNDYGQLGTDNTSPYSSPVTTSGGGSIWTKIAIGYQHSGGIKSDGTLWMWGSNVYGRLGINSTIARSSPVTTSGGGTTWTQIALYNSTTMAIKTDGTLWCWGRDSYGCLGDNSTINKSSPVTVSGGGTTWSKVACGYYMGAAIKTDGTLWTWGWKYYGQLGTNNNVNYSSPVTVSGGGTTWKQIDTSGTQVLAVKTDGTMWGWGRNDYGQLGLNSTTGKSSPCQIMGNNWTKVIVGNNTYGQAIAIKTLDF
jgi:alpha-tubulin suppressor-like RCC1 family protein